MSAEDVAIASTPAAPAPGLVGVVRPRLFRVFVVLAYFQLGMHGIGAVSAGRAHSLATALDQAIPFVPWTVYPYSAAYAFVLLPLFVIRCPRLFARTLRAAVAVLTVSFVVYLAWPVTSLGLRVDPATLDRSVLHGWGLAFTYRVDPPYNLFPSLHLSMAVLSMLAAYEAQAAIGLAASPLVAAIAVSICTTKQHFVVDGVAAIVLSIAAYVLWIRPYRAEAAPASERSTGWAGALLFASVLAAFFGAFAVVHRVWILGG